MAGTKYPLLSLECVVADELEALFRPGGALRSIVERVLARPATLDLTMHHVLDAESTVSLLAGTTNVLQVALRGHTLTLDGDGWSETRPLDTASEAAPAIDTYLDNILESPVDKSGAVRGLLSAASSSHYRCLQRCADISFLSTPLRDQLVDPLRQRIWDALYDPRERAGWWPTAREDEPTLGTEMDALALDAGGRVLAIEARPATDPKGLAGAPAEARLHAELLALWLDVDPTARATILAISQQRGRIGLAVPDCEPHAHARLRVVPVVAVGPAHALDGNVLADYLARLQKVSAALDALPPHSARIDAMEVWQLDDDGDRSLVER